jgi:peptidoglycan/xylan/chitin deacetylase (PgdA/CDA1 family)
VRRNLLLENGGFNEYFRAAEEEMELGQRLHVLGFEFIFEPKARMLHKNTKVWSSYYRNGWRARGALDPYRVFELNQRTPQTQRLAAPCRGFLWERMTARLAWEFPTPFEHLSGMLERIANRTRIHSLFGAWARVARASSYWSEVRKSEHTIEELRQSAGREKTALMMHSICDPQTPAESSYYISPRRFHRFMERFRSAGYKTANLNQWHNDKVPAGHVLLTFDDGYDDLYTELFPFLAENRFTAVIFLVAGQIGGSNVWDQKTGLRARNLLTLSQIREMQKHGVEFGSHTLTHPYLPEVSDAELRHEVTESKKRLEDLLGVEVTSFAYPFGGVDRRVRSAVVTAGYLSAFTIVPGPNWWNDPYSQRRAEVNDYSSSLDFAWKLRTGLGFTASLGMRLSSLENELPTSFLRKAAARVHALGHGIVQKLRPEGQRM